MYRLLCVARILKANFRNKHLILPYDDLKKIYFIFFLLSLLSKKFSPNNFDTLKLHFPAIFGANFFLKKCVGNCVRSSVKDFQNGSRPKKEEEKSIFRELRYQFSTQFFRRDFFECIFINPPLLLLSPTAISSHRFRRSVWAGIIPKWPFPRYFPHTQKK